MNVKRFFFVVAAVCLLQMMTVDNGFAQTDRTEEVHEYIRMLKSDSVTERTAAAKKISRSGLTDPQLFDLINGQLLNGYQSDLTDSMHIDEMAWLCKALASSGISEYKTTLGTVADTAYDSKLRKYAEQSLELIDEYAEKNRIMADTQDAPSGESPEVTRHINMLKSDKLSLKKDAAREIYRSTLRNERLFDVVSEEILKGLQLNESGSDYVDTMAWLCKALGSSGMSKYSATLQQVVDTTFSIKLQKYAKQSLDMLY